MVGGGVGGGWSINLSQPQVTDQVMNWVARELGTIYLVIVGGVIRPESELSIDRSLVFRTEGFLNKDQCSEVDLKLIFACLRQVTTRLEW